MDILRFSLPEMIFGRGSIKYAGKCAKRMSAKKVFFVTDPGLEKTGWVDLACEILEKEKLNFVQFSNVFPNPRDYQIEEGARIYREEHCDVVMCLGGGSPMDAAKGIALVASNGGGIRDYEGANRISLPLPPMIFLPSTAGSGSDISQFAIITDVERQVKMSLISRTLVPNVSITDPVLLTTKPEDLIIASAVDALAHAIESYVSKIACAFSELHSLHAIKLIVKHLVPALETRSLDHLEKLSNAGSSAAMAFSNASLGMGHALAHSLGGKLDVVHGLVHPVLLPHVMRYNLPECVEKIADIGEIFLGYSLGDPMVTAGRGLAKLEAFFQSLGVTTRLRDIVPDRSILPGICETAAGDTCLLSNPRSAGAKDMLRVCERAW